MFGCFFSDADTVTNFAQVMACNSDHFQRYFHLMLDGGVYLAPSAFEAGFISIVHGDAELAATLAAAENAFAALAS
jgi:glutamate-1-semialdehyde 2,1-aminomutase